MDQVALEFLKQKVADGEYEVARHAVEQTTARGISLQEILEAIQTAEVIEDYPQDKYWPSCLLLGHSSAAVALHILCSYPTRPLVKIITAYEPNPEEWIAGRIRRITHA